MSLVARGLDVDLGKRRVLRGIDLTAPAGQLTAIIGPNGSGKTTLLRCLTGEIAATSGTVFLNGRDTALMRPEDLASVRAVLPQQTTLSFPFTVAEVVSIALTASPTPMADRAGLVRSALSQAGLPGYSGRLYQQLSGGEQQRVQLARALAQVWTPTGRDGPRWLFLDEPVSSLDIAHQMHVMETVQAYARDGGGVIAVMHDLNLTAMFADHVMLMCAGRIVASGTPQDVMTDRNLSDVYNIKIVRNCVPADGIWVLPQAS
ncbi:heme ABC transporter ATP-binding protein [Paracoccus sp. TK19116]|uniref:Heme ABC transporter ATP-binding protein n=1 Tax=Paracoccus albicereus TaxID=2922394 RepID=A0ABT1MVS4_9RHOB|nr:heme ABC transporter ATP-binding protein [Paracoccus albicereus]MCQ0971779.1 heme ABC transporter ATP-binding protein [Paracoccus albicereus]